MNQLKTEKLVDSCSCDCKQDKIYRYLSSLTLWPNIRTCLRQRPQSTIIKFCFLFLKSQLLVWFGYVHVVLLDYCLTSRKNIADRFNMKYSETIQCQFTKLDVPLKSAVNPPCETTSRKRPPLISDHLSKTPKFPRQSLTVGTSSKRPPLASYGDPFQGDFFINFHCFRPLVRNHQTY